jgi:hypothetical protein
MKHLLVLLLTVSWCSRLLAADDAVVPEIWKNPIPFLEEIVKQIPSIDPTVEGDTDLSRRLQTMAYAINQEIMAAESQDWAHPSPARKDIIEKWGKALEPYAGQLLDLALGDTYRETYSARQSRSLLDFAAPSEKFASEVRKYVSPSNPRSTGEAVNLLFEHRLLSDSDKDVLRQLMPSVGTEEDKIRYALTMHSYGITDWDAFLLDKAEKLLTEPPLSNEVEVIADHYSLPLALARGGIASDKIAAGLSTIKSRLEVSHVGLHNVFEGALEVASGQKLASQPIAKNGSGFLNQSLAPNGKQVEGNPNPSEQSPPTPKKAPEAKPSLTTPSEEPASSTPWSIIVVLIVAAIGLLWLLLKKRK